MGNYKIVYSIQAQKDAKKLKKNSLKDKALVILRILENDPFQTPPRYESLIGDLKGCYSRRINIQHRMVYEVFEEEKVVRVLKMWTHYE